GVTCLEFLMPPKRPAPKQTSRTRKSPRRAKPKIPTPKALPHPEDDSSDDQLPPLEPASPVDSLGRKSTSKGRASSKGIPSKPQEGLTVLSPLDNDDDMDDQTKQFLREAMGTETTDPAARSRNASHGDDVVQLQSLRTPPTLSGSPGHLLSPTSYRRAWLSSWLDQQWFDYVPPGFVRMKDFKQQDTTSQPLAITAVILAAQAFTGRLFHSGLISHRGVAHAIGHLCDVGFGQGGTMRAKFALDTMIQEAHSAVLEGSIPDVDLSKKHPICPTLEQILCKNVGFTPPPVTSTFPSRSSKKGRSKYEWDAWGWSQSSTKEDKADKKADKKQ
ncbi:hypothetical protein FOL47_003038, partial [Perkinsus chesapeaki]